MSQKVYAGSLALTKLQSAIITTKKGAKCILIPIEANYLTEKDGSVYLNCGVVVRDEVDKYGQNGFISHKLSTEKYKELGAEKAKNIELPILGNIKDFGTVTNDSAGVIEIEKSDFTDFDDLGF